MDFALVFKKKFWDLGLIGYGQQKKCTFTLTFFIDFHGDMVFHHNDVIILFYYFIQ